MIHKRDVRPRGICDGQTGRDATRFNEAQSSASVVALTRFCKLISFFIVNYTMSEVDDIVDDIVYDDKKFLHAKIP